jgi:LuxR family maltose regulon positive regulatory protein
MGHGGGAAAHEVDRPALRRRLDEALTRPLTLVVAPAGSGKSVLLSQWAGAHPELSWVWLDIDPADDDPVRFCQRLLGGLADVDPELGELATLVPMHAGGLGTPLIEALGGQLLAFPETVIVLDDLHRLHNAVLLADLGRLVEFLPSQVHLVLSSRVDLPVAWSRHRLRLDMAELRQADLALDDADSGRMLERITGRRLDPDSVSALVQRTEGWAAGLQLAGMTLRDQADTHGFVTQFSGNDRLVADYLSEEVLDAQPEQRRRLLLGISVLDEMCAELVSRLTGEAGAQLILEELERASMFLVPLDTRRQWYRFHHLFRELLRFRLRAEEPGTEAILLGKAAEWHLSRGEVGKAVDYLVAAEDWKGALGVIKARGSEVFERGQMATVTRWIGAIPETERTEGHEINLLLAFLIGTEGQIVASDDILRRVAADPGSTTGEQACALAFRSAMVQSRTDVDASVELATQALDTLARLDGDPVPNVLNLSDRESLEAMATMSGGRAHFLAGRFDAARDWIGRGLEMPGATYSIWRIHGLGSLGLVEALCGRIDRAEALAAESLAIARQAGRLSHPAPADAYLTTALVALERGEPRRAALPLHEASVRYLANRRTQTAWLCQLATAMRHASEGQIDEAMSATLAARNDLTAPPPPVVAGRLVALRCRLLRSRGMPGEALTVPGADPAPIREIAFEHAMAALTLGRSDVAAKVLGAAPPPDPELEPLPAAAHSLARAWLADADGSVDDVDHHLGHAVGVIEGHGLVEVVVRAGPTVVRLVSHFPGASDRLRAAVGERARQVIAPAAANVLVEPLTDRELEILAFLPSRYTNAELAEHCYVSVNTIKTHMAHIYRKLDAPNRNAAIIRARELDLL